jgi:hemolysin activation/secretion protein
LKKIHFLSVFLIFAAGCFSAVNAQEVSLVVKANLKSDQQILDSLEVAEEFENVAALEAEILQIQKQLYAKGYVGLKFLGLKSDDLVFTATFELGSACESILIYGHSDLFKTLGYNPMTDPKSKQLYVEISIDVLEDRLEQISKFLSSQSYPFSVVQLQNIQPVNKQRLRADLKLTKGSRRQLEDIKILGYKKFPRAYVKHFLDIKKQSPFDLERIKSQMELLNQLPFVQQKRPAEVLFTEDSTTVYLYLEKAQSNRFDGFLGFGSNETTGKVEFDGYLDLSLINNLNYGESLKLNYKSDEIDQKTLDIALQLPYLFGTALGSTLNLNIFKKDSTFSTAQQAVKLYYQLDQSQRIGAGIRLQQSNGISDNIALAVEDFDSQFYNLNYSYIKRQKKDALFPIKTQLEIALAFGKRNGINSVEQRQSQIKGSHILNLNLKNSIFLKLHLEELQSKAYLFNELLRFGGITSIRGFRENSLFATRLGVLCSEYRYRLSPGLFVHSVMDAGYFQDINSTNYQIFGFGFGFGLRSNGGLLRLTYANGKNENTSFDFSQSKVHLSFTSTF